jgi:predicted glycosyltransferase
MKIWIDLSNSPHPLLFGPIARKLEELGHTVQVTARDNAQTLQLARERWPLVEVFGGESPAGRAAKAAGLADRARKLRHWARVQRPDVALSHNSYAQIIAARLARIPVVTAMDFEHQPANHLAFRLAQTILVPQAIPVSAIRAKGAREAKVHRYPGLKEEIYLGEFEPNPGIVEELGIERGRDTVVVVLRTPPARAIYHRFQNPLFEQVLDRLSAQVNARVVALARHPEQVHALEERRFDNFLIPRSAVDSRSLVYAADLVIGAGGTMTREAALMGVPTVSIYAGDPPAVDLLLEDQGRLRRLASADELGGVEKRAGSPASLDDLRARCRIVLESFVQACEQAVAGHRRSS